MTAGVIASCVILWLQIPIASICFDQHRRSTGYRGKEALVFRVDPSVRLCGLVGAFAPCRAHQIDQIDRRRVEAETRHRHVTALGAAR